MLKCESGGDRRKPRRNSGLLAKRIRGDFDGDARKSR